MTSLLLASTSRYRRALLERLRLPFEVAGPDCDEAAAKARVASPEALARGLAESKAESLAARYPDHYILGGDQVAEVEGHVLDKPETAERARAQLAMLAGREHRLWTAVCLRAPDGTSRAHLDVHTLRMRPLDPASIARYVEADQPFDCCGSYRIEALGIALFETVSGRDFTAIEGLPLLAVAAMLREAGFDVP